MWIHVPSVSCRFVVGLEPSTSELNWLCQQLEQSCTLNGKSSAAKSWLRGWKTKPWIRRLCLRICSPSTVNHGVEQWISLWAGYHAKPPQQPGSKREMPTNDGSGTKETESSMRSNPSGSSGKTSPVSSPESYLTPSAKESLVHWKKWVTGLRAVCLQRRKLARHTSGNVCSSWAAKRPDSSRTSPTKTTGRGLEWDTHLVTQAELWQTPNLPNGGDKTRGGDRKNELLLEGQSSHVADCLWRTPATTDTGTPIEKLQSKDGGPPQLGHRMYREGKDGEKINQTQSLEMQAAIAMKLWPTQEGSEAAWQTPTVTDSKGRGYSYSQGNHDKPFLSLTGQSEQWATPNAAGGTGYMSGSNRDTWRPTLEGQAQGYVPRLHEKKGEAEPPRYLPSPQDQPISPAGEKSSSTDPTSAPPSPKKKRRLSPCFVEYLMGLPVGFTDCAPLGMPLFQEWLVRHGEPSSNA